MGCNANYKSLLKDPRILKIYTNIDLKQKSDLENFIADHGMFHIKRVLKNIRRLCKISGIKNSLRNDYYIAAILHDIGMENGKLDHDKRSAIFAVDLLRDYQYTNSIDQVISAISGHSDCIYDENSILIILTLADKLDITYHRVGFAGTKTNGMRQLLNISKILIKRHQKSVQFRFDVNNNFNIKEFEEFYFYNKLIGAIKNFCYYFNLEYKILFKRRNYDRRGFLVKPTKPI